MPVIEKILTKLKEFPEIDHLECGSDYRRKKEVVGDVDILIVTSQPGKVFEKFHRLPAIKYIVATKPNLTTVQLKLGIFVNLMAVPKNEFGARLLYATGSIEHYKHLREFARTRKKNLVPAGLYLNKKRLAAKTETEIYHALNLQFIPPELREDRGEISAAAKHNLPQLITLSDIKGDLHSHTNETDGVYTLEEMAEAARALNYEYLAITDHSYSLRITNGMDEKRLLKQIKKIDKLNEKLTGFTILKSMEVDILLDGSLDLKNPVLKELDLTVCSIHSRFRIPEKQQTERILRAMDNPYFNILGHATGRLIQHRIPYELDLTRIFQAAKDRNCFIEVNAQPSRLDINDLYCKKAKEMGVKFALSTDAHSTRELHFMILGINQARRGWLEANDVINTYSLKNLIKILRRK